MIQIDPKLAPADLQPAIDRLWRLSDAKIRRLDAEYDPAKGSPVFTIEGKYTTRGWTEWTQGFQFGSALLQFDATGEGWHLDYARRNTIDLMAPHVSHFGVHDHGFNNVSTYGNLLRLIVEGKVPCDPWEKEFHILALKLSGAAQARRWTRTAAGGGFLYSFNGPHSLFVDTIRSCRALGCSWLLGHKAMDEGDVETDLLGRLLAHCRSTAQYSVFYGEGRDSYDEWGRTAHECVFNVNDGRYRCPNTQQGYSGFSTWTRGLAWAMTGFAEELEFLAVVPDDALEEHGGRGPVTAVFEKAARATCDFFINRSPVDGIPYWDTGAPGLVKLEGWAGRPAQPDNPFEPVDSSAAAIGAQGLLRLGRWLGLETPDGQRYWQAGLTVARTLFAEPYLSPDESHHGLLLHSVYHRPNGWDHIPADKQVPYGESSMWGDYHARELALLIGRYAAGRDYRFFDGCLA
jgi:unsaturated chondroitin disaccharide hydrolase